MNLLFYSPDMEGHPQLYCRVLADLLLPEGHRIVIAGAGRGPDWAREWETLRPLVGHGSVEFVDTRRYGAADRTRLRAEELRRLQRDHAIESTLLIEGDHFADELIRVAEGAAPRLHGRTVGIFARTSGWYPRENDYGGAPDPRLWQLGPRAAARRLLDLTVRRRRTRRWFYETALLRNRAVDAVVVKDERVSERFGPPVHWMPEIFKVFGPERALPPLPSDLESFIRRAGPGNVLLYFGTGARYKGYDMFLRLADLDPTSFALHAGLPLRDSDRAGMRCDVDGIRARLLAQDRLLETGSFVPEEVVDVLFRSVDRFVSTHRLTLSSGTMLQALDAGRPVLTASTGQVGHRTRAHGLGMTYRYGDAEDLRDQWIAFRRAPARDYLPRIRDYMGRFSRDAVLRAFRPLLTGTGVVR